MIKINLKVVALFFFAVITLYSCSTDDKETPVDYGISTGNYFPLVENNKWWYTENNEMSLLYIGGVLNFNNVPYHRLLNSDSDYPEWISKQGASYFKKTGQVLVPAPNGATVEIGEYEIKILKDDVDVGASWMGSPQYSVRVYNGGSPQSVPATLRYTGTILERDVIENINGVTYSNVIKANLNIVQVVNSQTTTIETNYWFAKDIGIIKQSLRSSTDNITRTMILDNYELN
ncbi:hypothetical protein ACFSX9_07125 [Flavobacterium ardleyense]|uniref:Lipoprotein n=1 Tax=Flavobacterium ardleyense TaxID=2038737 RepID=A0ABW5Z6M2_9FLAO